MELSIRDCAPAAAHGSWLDCAIAACGTSWRGAWLLAACIDEMVMMLYRFQTTPALEAIWVGRDGHKRRRP